jgi:hypothetical protein
MQIMLVGPLLVERLRNNAPGSVQVAWLWDAKPSRGKSTRWTDSDLRVAVRTAQRVAGNLDHPVNGDSLNPAVRSRRSDVRHGRTAIDHRQLRGGDHARATPSKKSATQDSNQAPGQEVT